jgi:hypothetical protein
MINLKISPFKNYGEPDFSILYRTQFKFGKQIIEIFNKLKADYNDQALTYATVARWVALFKNGR